MITITGIVGSSGKYLVTGIPVNTQTHTVLKIAFENNMSGTNLGLFAGTDAEFASGSGGLQLSDSGGPGFQFLTIIDTHSFPARSFSFAEGLVPRIRSSLSRSNKMPRRYTDFGRAFCH